MSGAAYGPGAAIARAYSGSLRRAARPHISRLQTREHEDRCAFPCHWYCVGCGFLVPQTTAGGYRAQDVEPPADCPRCGDAQWADLRESGVTETLADRDEELWKTRHGVRHGLMMIAGTLLGIAAVYAMWLPRPNDGSIFVFGPLLLFVLLALLRPAFVSIRNGRRPRHPTRWAGAPVPKGRALSTHRGRAHAVDGQLLQAPLSGRPCLAYELGVRQNIDFDAPAWTWQLLEQHAATIEIDGHRIAGDRIRLELARERCSASTDDPAIRAALRRRGFDPTRPGYVLVETIVSPDDEIEVRLHRNGVATATA